MRVEENGSYRIQVGRRKPAELHILLPAFSRTMKWNAFLQAYSHTLMLCPSLKDRGLRPPAKINSYCFKAVWFRHFGHRDNKQSLFSLLIKNPLGNDLYWLEKLILVTVLQSTKVPMENARVCFHTQHNLLTLVSQDEFSGCLYQSALCSFDTRIFMCGRKGAQLWRRRENTGGLEGRHVTSTVFYCLGWVTWKNSENVGIFSSKRKQKWTKIALSLPNVW